jgi:hypothetical protein
VVVVYAVVDDALSSDFPLGDPLEVFVRREDAERFVEIRGDDPELASYPRIEERNPASTRRRRRGISAAGPAAAAPVRPPPRAHA